MAQDPTVPVSSTPSEEKLKVYGNVGTEHYGGYFSEESNREWREINRVELVEEMRRGDGAVSAVLRAIKSPLLSANWFIAPGSEEEKDKEIADFVEDQLFHMPFRSWKELLREILTYLDFGHSVFEKIWVMDKGKIILTDLAPRIQHSIEKWQQADGQPGIQQRVRNDANKEDIRPYFYFDIPEHKLVIFSNDKEGDDVTGISVLRSAYIHYFMKNKAYKMSAIPM